MSSDDRWCEATGLAPTWAGETSGESADVKRCLAVLEETNREASDVIATLRTKLAMREQQLREADARVDELEAERRDLAVAGSWEPIVQAALRWRDGADRGELVRAVDAFRGQSQTKREERWLCDACGFEAPTNMGSHQSAMARENESLLCTTWLRRVCSWKESAGAMVSDLKGLAARESIVEPNATKKKARAKCVHCGRDGYLARGALWVHLDSGLSGCGLVPGAEQRYFMPKAIESVIVLRPEQYADGAGAQAWRQAMGGKL